MLDVPYELSMSVKQLPVRLNVHTKLFISGAYD